MSLSQALSTSVSGLRTTQAALSLVAANVANAQTPGYVRKTLQQTAVSAGSTGVGVRVAAINRELDLYVQRQLRIETSGGTYADLRAEFYQRLQRVYGEPGAPNSLEAVFNKLTEALQTLATSPESMSARSIVISSAQVLAQQLNGMTSDIQTLRGDAERGLSDVTASANNAMAQIANINRQLATTTAQDASAAALLDQRDAYIAQLSELMDISVVNADNNQVNVFTNSGLQLVGTQAAQLTFNAQGTIVPGSHWDADPTKSTVGTLVLAMPHGGQFDLIANHSIRAGQIAAYIDMRDNVLVQAQAQLDEIAAGLSRSLSDKTVAGTSVSVPPQSGFDVDAGALLSGNTVNLAYTDTATGQQRRVTIVRVDDPSVLPLAATATTDPNDQVIGIDFSAGLAAAVSQLNTQFNGKIQFSSVGTTLRVLDDGAPNLTNIDSMSATHTVASLTAGSAELPFFTDGFNPYSGAITKTGVQSVGLAGRIAVNPALLANPSRLVVYSTSPQTDSADGLRPNFIFNQLTQASLSFSPESGIGSTATPYTGPISSFMRQMLSIQGEAASNAESLATGQAVVVNALQERVASTSGVNVDQEMANLITLQTAYGANARILSTVKEMIETLMRM